MMQEELKRAHESKASRPLIDTKGLGKPIPFTGQVSDWESWHFKFVTWMGSQFGEAEEILEWASTQEDTIGQGALDSLELDHPRTRVFKFNGQLYGVLVSLFEMNSEPMELVRNSARGMGLDAWRRLCGKYDPSNPQTNLVLLKRVLNPPRSTMEHLQSNLEKWERELRVFLNRSKETLGDPFRKMLLHSLVPERI